MLFPFKKDRSSVVNQYAARMLSAYKSKIYITEQYIKTGNSQIKFPSQDCEQYMHYYIAKQQ